LGLDYFATPRRLNETASSIIPTATTITSLSSPSSATSMSSKELVSLEGELFVGWDGNGIRQIGMPPLSNEKMVLVGGGATPEIFAETKSDSSGHWEIDSIPIGDHVLYSEAGDTDLRYMCQSNKDFAPVRGVDVANLGSCGTGTVGGYALSLNESRKMNFEFSNGFLTLPFKRGTYFEWGDPFGVEGGLDWKGNTIHFKYSHTGEVGQPGQHLGYDLMVPRGTPVVAAAPGEVKVISVLGSDQGIFLTISHGLTTFETLYTLYAHMSKVEVSEGQQVYRGQRLGLSGGVPGVDHLHFQLDSHTMTLDPFASVIPEYSVGYWTKKNNPQFSV